MDNPPGRPHATLAERRQVRMFGVLAATPAIAVGLADVIHDGNLRGSGLASLSIGATSLTLALLHRAGRAHAVPAGQAPPSRPRARSAPVFRAGIEGEPQVGIALAF